MTTQKLNDTPEIFHYADRIGNLTAEAVGVVKGEKYFPVFEGRLVFKPLTKSKPLSTPLFAYAEVFWSWLINAYFMPTPQYRLAFCYGYEAETGKYYDYGTVSPVIYQEGEHLMNLLEFFRKYPDKKVHIDQYVNYCQMFYDYTEILEADYFQQHQEMAQELVRQILISILKGDQNYHYENVAFVCDETGEILRVAPMIDHEFSTYFMFPDSFPEKMFWLGQLQRSIEGRPLQQDEFAQLENGAERKLMEKSAVCLHGNLLYIREHYPEVTTWFLEKLSVLEQDLNEQPERFHIEKGLGYPDRANSNAYLIGKARYKDHDEKMARYYEEQYGGRGKEINFMVLNSQLLYDVKTIIRQIKKVLMEQGEKQC